MPITFKLPTVSGSGSVVGAYSYATGTNINGKESDSAHGADVSSSDLDQKSFQITVPDGSLTPGDKVDFSFKLADGSTVTVTGATIQLSSGGSSDHQLQGVLTAIGKIDGTDTDIAVLVKFNSGSTITKGDGFYSDDTHLTGTKGTDVSIDAPINFLYIGNYADADTNETAKNYAAENAGSVFTNAMANSTDKLALVSVQLIDADGTDSTNITDNDRPRGIAPNGHDGGDYVIYKNPETGIVHNVASDSTMLWNADVTYIDSNGVTKTVSMQVVVIQMANGDTFVTDLLNKGALDNLNIKSIKLTSLINSDGAGFSKNQSVDGSRVVCFTHSVPILTGSGYVPAGDLKIGDLVDTADHGPKPILWIGRRHIDSIGLAANPKLYPVQIRKGALGYNIPTEDILVSRQHRMLIRSKIARNMFGTDEVLIPAIKLIDLPGIEIATDVTEVVYVHFMFDEHELVLAAGAPSESLFPGPEALKALSPQARDEIFAIFPHLEKTGIAFHPARDFVSNKMAKKLIDRHGKKGGSVAYLVQADKGLLPGHSYAASSAKV